MYAANTVTYSSPQRGIWTRAVTAMASFNVMNRAKRARKRHARALWALELGAERVYRTYTQALSAHDYERGKDEAEQRARQLAKRTAIMFGETEGIDILRELSEAYIDLWIQNLVARESGAR